MPPPDSARLRFLGAAGTVTGSRYLIEAGRHRVLVDCGLYQGYKQLRRRNRKPFPVRPGSITAILLTHAHLDHSGYLPALIRSGCQAPVYCTPPTRDLCGLLLPDSGRLQEEEAQHARRKGYSRHKRPSPLYTEQDARAALRRFKTHPFGVPLDLGGGLSAEFIRAGHLLGAAQIRVSIGGKTVHFSGDLGQDRDPLMPPPEPFPGADVLVCESTYGDRLHPAVSPEDELAGILAPFLKQKGIVLIPAFAVGRAQGITYHLSRLMAAGRIPRVPVFLDSPMASDATDIYLRHCAEHRIPRQDCAAVFQLPSRTNSVAESRELNTLEGPMVILSASGMITGGRILHHVVNFGGSLRTMIVLSGYQAGGTRGASLAAGERRLRIFGKDHVIRARVAQLETFSGHADADELLRWMAAGPAPAMTYLTHGETEAADTLRRRISHELHRRARVPEHLEAIRIGNPA